MVSFTSSYCFHFINPRFQSDEHEAEMREDIWFHKAILALLLDIDIKTAFLETCPSSPEVIFYP